MNRPSTSCSDDRLWSLLQADDGDDNQISANHIAECRHCQNRLEHLAADPAEWRDIRESLLANDELDALEHSALDESTDNRQWARERWTRPTAWSDSMAKSLLARPSHPEMLGRIGRYDVERLIGSGGMGVVFKAYDTELNRPVAIKLLAPYLAENGSARKRFAREARAAAAVVDEHVVAIHNVEAGDDPEKPPFLVMKYIAGGSLQQRLDRDGPLDVCEILRIGMQTAKGLAAAHAQGLIHRDVKPSNILLDEGVERALLTDFGLARAEDDACLTRSGFHPGTPHYMSPEQVRGEAIDGRSDLFGLGCVLYAMCTGHPPFRAETSYAVLRRITDDPARPIRELNANIPEWLERIVMKLLSKSPTDRFDSAEEVSELLEDCLAHVQHPTTSPLPNSVEQLSQSLPSPQSGGFGSKQLSKWLYIGFAAFSLIFAGVLIVLELNKGTLTIQSDADDVPIHILRGDKAVQQLTVSQAGKSIRIAAGNYVVEVDQSFDGAVVHEGRVSLKRGDTVTVRITQTAEESSRSANERVVMHSIVASGKVLTRSGEQVEVSIGADDGVRLGDRLNIMNALQSEVEVIRVQNNQSLARIVGEDNSSPISPGAQVILSRPKPSTPEGNQNASSAVVPGTGKVVAFVQLERQQAPKEGDELPAIVPAERAVELWISGDDAPFVRRGDRVRLEFEGWPAAGSTNSFRGEVFTIDPTADGEGQFRILVKADSNDSWPNEHYLHPGVRANGWVLTESHRDSGKKVSDTLDASRLSNTARPDGTPIQSDENTARKLIQGRWISESTTVGSFGGLVEEGTGPLEIYIGGDPMQLTVLSHVPNSPISVGWPEHSWKTIPYKHPAYPVDLFNPFRKAESHQGIFYCDGDTLELCFSEKFRPKILLPWPDVYYVKFRRVTGGKAARLDGESKDQPDSTKTKVSDTLDASQGKSDASDKAIVMLMHPAELKNGNTVQQAAASVALGQLLSTDYCGILQFTKDGVNWLWGEEQGLVRLGNDRAKYAKAIANSQPGDLPTFDSALKMSLDSLASVNANNKRMIILTDGDPVLEDDSILNDFRDAGIEISVVHVVVHEKEYDEVPRQMTRETGGRYYRVADASPATVEQLFLREARMVKTEKVRERSGTSDRSTTLQDAGATVPEAENASGSSDRFKAAISPTAEATDYRGKCVRAEDGVAIAGAVARFFVRGKKLSSMRLFELTTTDQDGNFRINCEVPNDAEVDLARCRIAVTATGRASRVFFWQESSEPARIEMQASASLKGRVTDSESRPVAGARVRLGPDRMPGVYDAVTDQDGRYEIADLVKADKLDLGSGISNVLHVEHPNGGETTATVESIPSTVNVILNKDVDTANEIGPGAADSTIYVMGLVQNPGKFAFPVGRELRLLDAIALAGGRRSQVADTVLLFRALPGQHNRAVIQASVQEAKQSAEANLILAPGDTLSLEPPRSTENQDEGRVPAVVDPLRVDDWRRDHRLRLRSQLSIRPAARLSIQPGG